MNITDYYGELNKSSQKIHLATMQQPEVIIAGHKAALDLYHFRSCIDCEEAKLLEVVCAQIEMSCLSLTYGLYRSAFTSLRLALEFGLGALYFSANKLAYREWCNELVEADIKWGVVNGSESGVFSTRFASAFFPQLREKMEGYRERASKVYRKLSEYVHGNNATWQATGLVVSYNYDLHVSFSRHLKEVNELVLFGVCCRFLRDLTSSQLEDVEAFLMPIFTHEEPIRIILGGPGDVK